MLTLLLACVQKSLIQSLIMTAMLGRHLRSEVVSSLPSHEFGRRLSQHPAVETDALLLLQLEKERPQGSKLTGQGKQTNAIFPLISLQSDRNTLPRNGSIPEQDKDKSSNKYDCSMSR